MTLFGHPLHPLTVHFPVALYLLGVLLTLGYLLRRQADYERFAYWSFILSWLGAAVASLSGLIDQNSLALDDPRRADVNNHITAAIALLVINGLVVYMRFRWVNVLTSSRRWAYLGLLSAGLVTVLAAAWLGGQLVYRLQIGVQGAG